MSSGRDRARIGGIRAGLAGAICLALAGCSATYDNHGYVPTDLDLEQVLPGVDTRDTIVDTIGRPSASGKGVSGVRRVNCDIARSSSRRGSIITSEPKAWP